MYAINPLKAVHQNLRHLSTSLAVSSKNHYDSLGITPKATQTDVKGAYYKLSMLYHPDKNKDSDAAAQKFRDITEAYEVLGNVRLRRLYDKGVSHIGGVATPDHPTAKFYKSREHRTRPPSTGRNPIYDFDEWSRAHYGATFAKDMERKRKIKFYKEIVNKENDTLQTGRVLVVMGVLLAILAILSYDSRNEDTVAITYLIGETTKPRKVPKVD